MNAIPAVRTLVLLAVCLFLIACSKDDKGEPEIIESRGGSEGSSAVAPDIVSRSTGSTTLSPAAVTSTTSVSGLTVTGRASGTVPADRASIIVMLQGTAGGPVPVVSIPQRDQEAIIAALQGLGIDRSRVEFETNTTYGPFATVAVEIGVDDVQTQGQAIIGAVSSVRGSQSSGVRFAISDCSAPLAPLRKEAIDAAAAAAQSIATAASLSLGPVVALAEAPSANPYGPPVQDPCAPSAQVPKLPVPGAILPLDSEREVTLDVNLSVTYGLGGAGASAPVTPELSIAGSGEVTARADEAYVLIATSLSGGGPFGPPQLQTRDREDLFEAITKLGIDEDDIEIDSAGFGGPLLVNVEVDIGKLPQIGRDVAGAVQSVIGSVEQQGVRFTHSNCQAVLDEARKQAVADARMQAESLARAGGLTLGGLLSISEGGNPALGPYGAPANGCDDDFRQTFGFSPYGLGIVSFNAEREFTVTSTLLIRYGITGP